MPKPVFHHVSVSVDMAHAYFEAYKALAWPDVHLHADMAHA
jgi:hypothetical protein